MSRLEQTVEPLLKTLVTGQNVELSESDQKTLALWCEKTVMINEFTDKSTIVSLPDQRERIRHSQTPDSTTTQVWIAHHGGDQSRPRLRHRTLRVAPPHDTSTLYGIRTTVGIAGKLLFFVAGAEDPHFMFPGWKTGQTLFQQIWPVTHEVVSWPAKGDAITDPEIEYLVNAAYRMFSGAPEGGI